MSVLQAAMSATGVLSMGVAGIAGDVIGIREVFLAAGAITGLGFLVALVGFRQRHHAEAPLATRPDNGPAGAQSVS